MNVNVAAYHWNRAEVAQQNLNEVNPGIGMEHDMGNYRVMVGVYENSIRRKSGYTLVGYTPLRHANLSAGVAGGVVTGYLQPVMPAVGAIASLQFSKMVMNFFMMPNFPSRGVYGFTGLQIGYKLN